MTDHVTTEKPIIYTGHSVREILAGRKTVTRRVMKPLPHQGEETGLWMWPCSAVRACLLLEEPDDVEYLEGNCPHGSRGDRLWVRETWAQVWKQDHNACTDACKAGQDCEHLRVEYKADTGNWSPGDWPKEEAGNPDRPRWRPSIFMPRWASRVDLTIINVRAERLHAITDDDVKAEGVGRQFPFDSHWDDVRREVFQEEWDKINGRREGAAWVFNPWVWRIEFEKTTEEDHD